MVSQAAAERLRLGQVGISALIERDLNQFWSTLNLGRPEAVRDALLEFTPMLVDTYGESTAAVAADWYDEQRAVERVPGRYRAVMATSPYRDAVEPMVRRAAGALFVGAAAATLATVVTNADKYALAAGRETIARSADEDPRATGWQRVTRPGSCRFCLMLRDRGAVYRETTVHFAAHKSCSCAAVPSWDRDAPEVDVRVYEASRRTSSMTPAQRERHNAAIRAYLGD